MKNYERPMILEVEEMAEGIYANSGVNSVVDYDNDPDCWSIVPYITQYDATGSGDKANVRFKIVHPSTNLKHISSEQTVTILFNQTINSAHFDSGNCDVNGATVVCHRQLLGDAYNSGDNVDCNIEIFCDDSNNLGIIEATVTCKHETNVQGEFD